MIPNKTTGVKRLQSGGERVPLDEKRLEAIRRRIADGYYDRKEVCRSIVERLVNHLTDADDEGEV